MKNKEIKHKLGDRVTRKLFLDDGTWRREGDSCLKRSPLLHGTVVEVTDEEIKVKWDNGALTWQEVMFSKYKKAGFRPVQSYLHHGVDKEVF